MWQCHNRLTKFGLLFSHTVCACLNCCFLCGKAATAFSAS